MSRVHEARKIGFLKWEADIEHGNITFTLPGWTKAGAEANAAKFVVLLAEKREDA